MSLKHAALTDVNLNITGCLIHEVRTSIEDVSIESMDEEGLFADGQGKSLRKKTTVAVSGEMLSTAVLPTVGDGKGISNSDVHIDRSEQRDMSEGASEFSVEGHYHSAGEGDWATAV